MRFLIRFFFAPLYFLLFIGASVIITQSKAHYLWLLPLLISALAISFCAERILPYQSKWNQSKKDSRRDKIHAIANETLTAIAIATAPILTATLSSINLWPHHWPTYLQLGAAILIADFGITVAHYMSHKITFLWRFHAVHHSVKRLYGLNGLMKHPLHQCFEMTLGIAPLILMGMPQEIACLLGFSVAIQLTLQHSNIDMKIGPLIYIWAIAPGHRHHHIASSTKGDVNFGLFTMIWDHALGTFTNKKQTPIDGELGIEGEVDFPNSYIKQLLKPFNFHSSKGNIRS